MQFFYRIAADATVVFHAAFVLFVVIGLVLILVGALRDWNWVRNLWFRIAHFSAIAFVVAESWLGITCPLTTWEHRLRELAGQSTYHEDFIAHWAHELLFFDFPTWAFTVVYSLFGLAVLATLLFAPPRIRSRHSPRAVRKQ